MKIRWEGYDESNFWLAFSGSPYAEYTKKSPRPKYKKYFIFFELFRYRVSIIFPRWGKRK